MCIKCAVKQSPRVGHDLATEQQQREWKTNHKMVGKVFTKHISDKGLISKDNPSENEQRT